MSLEALHELIVVSTVSDVILQKMIDEGYSDQNMIEQVSLLRDKKDEALKAYVASWNTEEELIDMVTKMLHDDDDDGDGNVGDQGNRQ